MKKIILTVSMLLILSLVPFSYAQFGGGTGPKFHVEFKPVVGGWAEYQMIRKGDQPTKMKIAIVGKEGDAYWYESIMEIKREGKVISKMLVSGSPDDTKNVKRMVVKSGDQPAMEMPVQMMPSSADQGQKGKLTDKGTETIKVPAGTFKTRHMQYQDGPDIVDIWVSKDISPYGIVKSQSKDFEMVLLGNGTGATTLITETPQKLEMPQLPERRQKRK